MRHKRAIAAYLVFFGRTIISGWQKLQYDRLFAS